MITSANRRGDSHREEVLIVDVRTPDERMQSALERLERIAERFDAKLEQQESLT